VQGFKHIPHKSSGVMLVGQVVSIPCVKKCTCPEASIMWAGCIRRVELNSNWGVKETSGEFTELFGDVYEKSIGARESKGEDRFI
jgi:predicted Fe-S protein YdhL (DUF1289 family)